jgi:hypothetical protein
LGILTKDGETKTAMSKFEYNFLNSDEILFNFYKAYIKQNLIFATLNFNKKLMKKVLILIFVMAISSAAYSQTMPSLKTEDLTKSGVETLAKENPELENQIKDVLKKDEGIQKETINYLKENPETSSALTKIISENKDSIDGVMKSILGDSQLTTAAIDWISNNPEMLNKVMKLAGM